MRRLALTFATMMGVLVTGSSAQEARHPKPTELPNPYRLVEHWPTLPPDMNGGHWGEVIRVHVDAKGNVWVFHRCFNVVPAGSATCVGRGPANPPILEFSPAGKLLRSFGAGLFAYPHGFTVDRDGNLWATDVNDQPAILGMSAKNAAGVVMGQEVLKLSPDGKVLMTLGTPGVGGTGPNAFDRPTGVAVAATGDIFVADGHAPNQHNAARIVKFSRDGRFVKAWGQKGSAPGELDEPHDIFVGGSRGWVYVADRRNRRVQVFDQDGRVHRRVDAIRTAERPVRRERRHDLRRRVVPGRDAEEGRAARHRRRKRHHGRAIRLHPGPDRPGHGCRGHVGVRHRGGQHGIDLRRRRRRAQPAQVRQGQVAVGSNGSFGMARSGIGLTRKKVPHARPSHLAQRADRSTRALSVAIPVFAYICRYIFEIKTNAMRPRSDRTTPERVQTRRQL